MVDEYTSEEPDNYPEEQANYQALYQRSSKSERRAPTKCALNDSNFRSKEYFMIFFMNP